ncbi:hypothetical protein PMIN06_006661 [Paraphaeosphaeria minitans]
MASKIQYLAFFLTTASTASLQFPRRAVSHATNLPNGWTYSGCYVDSVADRELKRAFQWANNQSAAQCISYCSNLGYDIAGTEWGRE